MHTKVTQCDPSALKIFWGHAPTHLYTDRQVLIPTSFLSKQFPSLKKISNTASSIGIGAGLAGPTI